MNKDIDKLLESIVSTTGKWYENIDKDTSDFLDAVANLVKQGKEVNAVKIADILEDEYNIKIICISILKNYFVHNYSVNITVRF